MGKKSQRQKKHPILPVLWLSARLPSFVASTFNNSGTLHCLILISSHQKFQVCSSLSLVCNFDICAAAVFNFCDLFTLGWLYLRRKSGSSTYQRVGGSIPGCLGQDTELQIAADGCLIMSVNVCVATFHPCVNGSVPTYKVFWQKTTKALYLPFTILLLVVTVTHHKCITVTNVFE